MTGPDAHRRTLYGFIDRLNLPGLYRTFDFPDPNATSPKRDQTTVAPQALFLMNHPFAIAAARAILARPEIAAHAMTRRQGRAALSPDLRPRPAPPRRRDGPRVPGRRSPRRLGPLAALAQALLMANEFVFVD